MEKEKIVRVLELLEKEYPDAVAALNFTTPFELLIATILSAQCTDVRVNKVTSKLYKNHNTPEAILSLGQVKLQDEIRTCGLANTKSKNIIATCSLLLKQYNNQVPDTIEELMTLPGVGRKTANVVVSNAFGKSAIAVDTHVFRVSNRIGLAHSKDVLRTEKDLMYNIPENKWSKAHHWLIFHGRNICKARNPLCSKCIVKEECQYNSKNI
ncbi:endonuclease III [Alkalibaculum sp. M08DMB]|uniref:Endonuclease III n=1 Tax=Alkalibaculum sporogenes TaxID=2655001 RepID=A0A6A7KC12_9FIRM|nr:endonuclease III [Alkalibaculum sporogenes]MPW26936.1 endonuclease III [Alkalibaculum sporogenes]